VTLPRTQKSQESLQLNSHTHSSQSGHFPIPEWPHTNLQFPNTSSYLLRSLQAACVLSACVGGHRHKRCSENENKTSKPLSCNCRVKYGENTHFANYRESSHVKEKAIHQQQQDDA
jgi:hypothetical protein